LNFSAKVTKNIFLFVQYLDFKITENERYIICKQNESEFSSEGRAPDRMKSEIVFLIRNGSKDASENFNL